MLTAAILQHFSLPVAMPFLPEDRSLVLLAGDGYVAGTALALILFPGPAFHESVRHPFRVLGESHAAIALKIKGVALTLATGLFVVWLLGHQLFPQVYSALPADRSLFAAIPLFGIADMFAACQAIVVARWRKELPIHQLKRGDTDGQLYSIALVSVYLGFWLSTVS